MTIEFNPQKVANLLKKAVNDTCEEGFKWYDKIGEMPSLFDMTHAIEILEKAEVKRIVVEDEEIQ